MHDIEAGGAQCFSNVFPDLHTGAIRAASTDTLAARDSVAHITLSSAISQQFSIDYIDLISCRQIVDALKSRGIVGNPGIPA
jgi:hypothetical protein